ncbi:YeiH family putative sulfate export transporter [Malaciobacter mytili LMG 24559]|uniref:YeiH family putative sulfate export transporter n=1 Tax=Malaciobacter mytili LMG 24559 TaxID=1032238 RepID=A0AAX2AED2_9BACT|nr:YeiH family protein [Malaciobacter mytili]AXH15477.1 YeiH/YadS family membrane protein [Malaciobacter mytili LMG 24559]RXK12038.1 YeiH family putative sulfate export transporter [Malaciobacter mytili LMG 24559]
MKEYIKDKNFYVGLALLGFFTLFAKYISLLDSVKNLGFSFLIVAILIGMIFTNILKIKISSNFDNSFAFATKTLLRIAIVFYGFRLTFNEIFQLGWQAFIVAIIVVCSTFILGYFIGIKVLKLDKEITILTSVGSAICGAAAILATEAVLKNKAYKSSVAVSTVVLFGTFAMFLYPYLYSIDFLNLLPNEMAIYIGGTLHEVAHVVGASNSISNETIENNAVVVKMIRVMLIAPFLVLLMLFLVKTSTNKQKSKITIPWFAIFFIGVAFFNSFNFVPKTIVDNINEVDTFCLAMAMMALGIKTNFKTFFEVGIKPIVLATILFIWLSVGGFFLIKFIV